MLCVPEISGSDSSFTGAPVEITSVVSASHLHRSPQDTVSEPSVGSSSTGSPDGRRTSSTSAFGVRFNSRRPSGVLIMSPALSALLARLTWVVFWLAKRAGCSILRSIDRVYRRAGRRLDCRRNAGLEPGVGQCPAFSANELSIFEVSPSGY